MVEDDLQFVDSEKFLALTDWLKKNGCPIENFALVSLPGSGRGLISTTGVLPGQYLLRIPESILINSKTVLKTELHSIIARHVCALTPFDALCLFLIAERVRSTASQWKPFIDILPDDDSVMTFAFDADDGRENEILLPPKIRQMYNRQLREIASCRHRVLRVWSDVKTALFANAGPIPFCDETLFRWAWYCVNTRCVFCENFQLSPLLNNTDGDTVALIPFLDLLNHSSYAKVEAGFSKRTQCYEMRTENGVLPGEEAFICYGPHSNGKLFLEYGFVLKENPNNAIYFDQEDLERLCAKTNISVDENNWKALTESKLTCPLYQTELEPPWAFMATFRLLSMSKDELLNWRRIFGIYEFEEEATIHLAKKVMDEYAREIEDGFPSEDAQNTLASKFRDAVMQLWQDERSIVAECLRHFENLLDTADQV